MISITPEVDLRGLTSDMPPSAGDEKEIALNDDQQKVYDAMLPRTARMHLFNPRWPPHAKFHNAQTMLLGIFFGTLVLVILFATRPLTLPLFLIAAVITHADDDTIVFRSDVSLARADAEPLLCGGPG